MAKASCLNVTMDDQKISSPMPVIGLYIAAASLVCFVFMLCDVMHGLRHRKPWIPCRIFSVNSLTFTLLAIVTKLPVDLTTSMPSALDQLSKLCATILLCISMGFFMPSLGNQGDSEWVSNMASLSILVVTVIVNICIQMATGVIFSFIEEHVIIMFCMLLMLIILWTSNLGFGMLFNSFNTKEIGKILKDIDHLQSSARMMDRLKSIYRRSYGHSTELVLSGSPHAITVGMLSTFSALVLLEATVRCLVLKEEKFHCGISDYKWSMWIIVVAQIFTILLGGIAITYRWFTSVSHFHKNLFPIIICSTNKNVRERYLIISVYKKLHILSFFKFSGLGLVNVFLNMVKKLAILLQTTADIMTQLATFLSLKMKIYMARTVKITKNCFCKQSNGEESKELDYEEWITEKSTEDMTRRIEKYNRSSTTNLIQILPNARDHLILSLGLPKKNVSSLLVVILVSITKVLLPDSLCASLIDALVEAFEIICFVYEKTSDIDIMGIKMRNIMAKDLWMNKDNNNHWFNKKFIKRLVERSIDRRSESQLSCALGITEELSHLSHDWEELAKEFCQELNLVRSQIHTISKLITDRNQQLPYASINDLHDHLKQLFAYMLNYFFSQLPLAIFKHVVESSRSEEYEESARLGIKFICKVKSLVEKVNWSFPDGTGITSLIDDDDDLSSFLTTTTHHIQSQSARDNEIQEHV